MSTRKNLAVWISGYLTFLSILFTFDAFFLFESPNSLLNLYPVQAIVQVIFGDLNAPTYIGLTAISTFILFGITCIFVMDDPFTALLRKMVSETQSEANQMDASLESSLNTLEMINHSLTSHDIGLNEVKNVLGNLKGNIETMNIGMTRLTEKLANMSRKTKIRMECTSCGNKILPEFRLCPYCGKKLSMYRNMPAMGDK